MNDEILENSVENGVNTEETAALGDVENTGVNSGEPADTAENGVTAESAEPQDMSDDDFEGYLDNLMNGSEPTREEKEQPEDAKEEPEKEEPENPKPFKSFATQKEYQAEIDRIFSKRHKDYNDLKEKNNNLVEKIKEFYEADDEKTALELFDNQILQQKAESEGVTAEEYKKKSTIAAKAKAYDDIQAKNAEVETQRKRLFTEESNIKSSNPAFDLRKMYATDPAFKSDLDQSGSAYANYVNRKSNPSEKPPAAKKKRDFTESGSNPSASAGRVSTSPADLSDKDFEDYIKKIEGIL